MEWVLPMVFHACISGLMLLVCRSSFLQLMKSLAVRVWWLVVLSLPKHQCPPSFVGNNYYCESGNPSNISENTDVLRYTSDPLWDGQQCEGQCCSDGRTLPWFSVTLANPITDDIKIRIYGSEPTTREDSPISLMELYVQWYWRENNHSDRNYIEI